MPPPSSAELPEKPLPVTLSPPLREFWMPPPAPVVRLFENVLEDTVTVPSPTLLIPPPLESPPPTPSPSARLPEIVELATSTVPLPVLAIPPPSALERLPEMVDRATVTEPPPALLTPPPSPAARLPEILDRSTVTEPSPAFSMPPPALAALAATLFKTFAPKRETVPSFGAMPVLLIAAPPNVCLLAEIVLCAISIMPPARLLTALPASPAELP